MGVYREQLSNFTEATLPNLDVVVLGALELFAEETLPPLDKHIFGKPLVLGSVNAHDTGEILFADCGATFADEATYEHELTHFENFDTIVVVSASGKKHAVPMVEAGIKAGVLTTLITSSPDSPAAQLLPSEQVYAFPKNREPYTYNTSTYLGPILSVGGEDSQAIIDYIEKKVTPLLLRNFEDYTAFTLIVPAAFEPVREMLRTKFDELFGPAVSGRVFTEEEIKHAKTVVRSGCELFIGFGVENEYYGLPKNRLFIPLPDEATAGALIAISYFVVGKIQAALPPYFKENIVAYCETASKLFRQDLQPIVE